MWYSYYDNICLNDTYMVYIMYFIEETSSPHSKEEAEKANIKGDNIRFRQQ